MANIPSSHAVGLVLISYLHYIITPSQAVQRFFVLSPEDSTVRTVVKATLFGTGCIATAALAYKTYQYFKGKKAKPALAITANDQDGTTEVG